jgi:mannose-6-phosphate isomerase
VPDFTLDHVVVGGEVSSASLTLPGAAIALCTAGLIKLAGENGYIDLGRGDSVYVTPDEGELTVTGDGTVFVATPNA